MRVAALLLVSGLLPSIAVAQSATPAGSIKDPWALYAKPATVCPAGFKPVGDTCFRICKTGYHASAAGDEGKCVKDIAPVVDRGFLGGCPTGYTDHPFDPKKCVLPGVAARINQQR